MMTWTLFYIITLFSIYLTNYSAKEIEKGVKESLPEYLSITADTMLSRKGVYKFIKKAMKHLMKSYPYDEAIKSDYQQIFKPRHYIKNNQTEFREPDSWHTTCLYIGANYSQLETQIYKQFIEGINIDIVSSTFVYIPGKIMSAPVFFKNFTLIENKYPHVTLMVAKYRAVDSNYVLKALFENITELNELYVNGAIQDSKMRIHKRLENVQITFDDLHEHEVVETVYLIKHGKEFSLQGVTTKNEILKYLE